MPRAEAVELALMELPGVELAVFARDEDARGSLRIRVAPGHNPSLVAEDVSQTLLERFSIDLPSESLVPRRPEPAEDGPAPRVGEPSLVATDDEPATAVFRVEQVLGSTGHKEVRIVDAAIEGEGLARRAVVILNQTGPEGGHAAMGASLVGASEALAVATATLQALSELDQSPGQASG